MACGPAVNRALEAAARSGGRAGVYEFRFIKPLDTAMLEKIARSYKGILTVEDGSLKGGLYGAVCEFLADKPFAVPVRGNGIPDLFIPHARQAEQRSDCGLDEAGISAAIEALLG